MKKIIATLFAAAAMSFGAHAAEAVLIKADIGVEVPVEMVVPATITQVLVSDGDGIYLMNTEQTVVDNVHVTPEMANNAKPFSVVADTLPQVKSVGEAMNNGESEGTQTPFTKLGLMEPIATSTSKVFTVFFKYGNDLYAYDSTQPVGDTVTLSHELIAQATKL